MKSQIFTRRMKQISFFCLTFLILGVIVLGLRTKSHVELFTQNLRSGASIELTTASAKAVSADLNWALSVANLPVIKQILSVANSNYLPVREEIDVLVQAAPVVAGAESPKRYLIVFQNSAEARGTGGILGAYAIIELDKGSLKVLKTGSNEPLYGISLEKIPVDVPAEFKRLYGENPAIIQNSNLSPHFPYGAEIWLELWKQKYKESLDGVIAVDPTALSYILRSTGPVRLKSGEVLTSENVVSVTLREAYKRFEKNNSSRKQYLVDILNSAAAKITNGEYSKIELARALKEGILENRILMYSTDKSAQKLLSSVRLGGFMSTSPNNEFRVVVQNIDAGKLDYYLQKSVTIESTSCKVPNQTQVRVRVTNTLKSAKGLPAYVLTRADKDKPKDVVPGQHRFKLFIYGPTKSTLVSVSRENKRFGLGGASTERERPIYVADVDLRPGESENLLANFAGGVGKISFVDQPLVRPTQLNIKGGC